MVYNFALKSELRTAIILTISYTDQFDFPQTEEEIYSRLIWRHKLTKPGYKDFLTELSHLNRSDIIEFSDGFYFLKNRNDLPKKRSVRQKHAKLQREEIEQLLTFLQKIPWIRGVVVTGSLALNAISSTDDSDFLLVVEPRRLWLTRVLVIFYAWMKGKRRSWRSEEDNSWCFNLWLDTDNLILPPPQRSVYSAYEVCQADWIWWQGRVAEEFYSLNSWAGNILPNYWQEKVKKYRRSGFSYTNFINPLGFLIDILDYGAFLLQLLYMKPHRTREKVSRGSAFFHPRDTKLMIATGWKNSILKIMENHES